MKRLPDSLYRLLTVIAGILIFAGPAYASATAGLIRGIVVDESGLTVPGALVTLSSPSMIGGAQQRTTNEEGRFNFVELPPGSYDLLVQKQGFSPVRKTGIDVAIGRTVEMTIELQVGQTEIVVEAERPVVDTEQTSKGSVFNQDFLSRIPTGRSYQEAVSQTAGMVGGGEFASGASYNENTYLLDGVNVTDPVTGTFSLNFNFDALEEIQVVTNDFDPEYGESLGARIALVTQSGGNTLEVNIQGNYSNGNWSPKTDERWAADGVPLAPSGFDSSAETGQVSAVVSGPLIKDRLWYLGAYEYNRTLYANVGIPLPRDYDGHYFFSKITAQPNSAHRFYVEFATNPTTIDNTIQTDRYVLPEAQERQAQGGYFVTSKWNWFISPDSNMETYVSFQKSFIESNAVPCTHNQKLGYNPCEPWEAENTVDFTTPGREGLYGAYSSQNAGSYYFDDRYRISLYSKMNLLQLEALGKHDLKFGFQGNFISWDQIYGYSGNLIYYDLYNDAFNPDTLYNLGWIEISGPSQYKAKGLHLAGHFSDTYKPVENLTLLVGTRYDFSRMYNDVGDAVVDVSVWGPRISAAWDPFGTEKTKISAGYGRFNDLGTLGLASYLSANGLGQKFFYGEYYFGGSSSVVGQGGGEYDIENTIQVFDNLTAPRTDVFALGGQREIIPDVGAGVDLTARFTRYIYTFDDTNLIYDEDGYSYVGHSEEDLDIDYRMRTPWISRRDYFQADVFIARNFAKRWQLQAVYSYVISKGTSQYSATAGLSNPSQVDLMYGNLYTDMRHQVKASGSWDIPNDPWTTILGFSAQYYGGSPISRYYYSPAGIEQGYDGYQLLKQPLGTYTRERDYWFLSLRAEQNIPVRKGKLGAVAEVENITNNQHPVVLYSSYVSTDNRYVIAYRQSAMIAKVGLKYEF